jgi:hypothetical protein
MRKELFGNQELFPAIRCIFFWQKTRKRMPFLSGLGVWVKLIEFTVFRKIIDSKEVSFG